MGYGTAVHANDTTHRFILYDVTTDVHGNYVPDLDSWSQFTINPIEYTGFGIKKIKQVDSLFETEGTIVEHPLFDYNQRSMGWRNIAKFKYFDVEYGITMTGSSYPQFFELKSREYHLSGTKYFLDDRGYSRAYNASDPKDPFWVLQLIRIDAVNIDGFATAAPPYFNHVELKYTPSGIYLLKQSDA